MNEDKNIKDYINDSIYKDMDEEKRANFINENTFATKKRQQKENNDIRQLQYENITLAFLIDRYHQERIILEKKLEKLVKEKGILIAKERQRVTHHHQQQMSEQKTTDDLLLKNLYDQKDLLDFKITTIGTELNEIQNKLQVLEKEGKELKEKDKTLAFELGNALRTNYHEIAQSNKSVITIVPQQIEQIDLINPDKGSAQEPLNIKLSDIAAHLANTIPKEIDAGNLSASQIHEAEDRGIRQCGRESLRKHFSALVKPSEVDNYVLRTENSPEYQAFIKEASNNLHTNSEMQPSSNQLKEALENKCKHENKIKNFDINKEQLLIRQKTLTLEMNETVKNRNLVSENIQIQEKKNFSNKSGLLHLKNDGSKQNPPMKKSEKSDLSSANKQSIEEEDRPPALKR
jgi:hypothetical protein